MMLKYLSQNPAKGWTVTKLAIKISQDLDRRITKQLISYYIKKLHNLGYIRFVYRSSNGSIYELTKEGHQLLTELYELHERSVKNFSEGLRVRMDEFCLRFPVLGRGVFRWDGDVLLRNWVKRFAVFGGLRVEETTRFLYVYVSRVVSDDPFKCVAYAYDTALRFINYFVSVTGYRVGPPELHRSPSFEFVDHPLAKAFTISGFKNIAYSDKEGSELFVDSSPPSEGELGFRNRKNYLLAAEDAKKFKDLPDMVESLYHKVLRLESNLARLTESMDKLATVLEGLLSGKLSNEKEVRGDFYG
jgi:DNA-binding PadR family transcriptional regulator